ESVSGVAIISNKEGRLADIRPLAEEDELASVTHGAVVYILGRRKRLAFGDAVPESLSTFGPG
ncbi:unnamed protein product, partial [Effrenium voratum]